MRMLTAGRHDRSPAWSPKGRWVVFERGARLYVVGADGRGLRRLTPRTLGYHGPAWSPDGHSIAFDRGGSIFLMTANGKAEHLIYRATNPPRTQHGRQTAPISLSTFDELGLDSTREARSWSSIAEAVACATSRRGATFPKRP